MIITGLGISSYKIDHNTIIEFQPKPANTLVSPSTSVNTIKDNRSFRND